MVNRLSVAVCLATFNGMQWLSKQIDSILSQNGVVVTIYVSVDSSSDGTEEWINQLASNDSRIHVLPLGKHFGGAARNFFRLLHDVDFSDFDYVSLADQDDIWLPNKLWRAHEVLFNNNADAYSSNVVAFWPNGSQIVIKKSQAQVKWDFLFEAAGPGCTYVMRKDLACAIQNLVKARWIDVQKVDLHDWFFYAFARTNGYRWIIDDYAGMLYRQHEKNQVGVNIGLQAHTNRVHKILNGWWLSQSTLIARLVGLGDNSFVMRWSNGNCAGFLWLAMHAWQCRRRPRDKILFALSCLVLCAIKKNR